MIGSSELSVPKLSVPRCLAVAPAQRPAAGCWAPWLLPIALAPGAGTFDATLVRAWPPPWRSSRPAGCGSRAWSRCSTPLRGRGRYAVGAPSCPAAALGLGGLRVALTGGVMARGPGDAREPARGPGDALRGRARRPATSDRATAPAGGRRGRTTGRAGHVAGHVAAHASPVVVRAERHPLGDRRPHARAGATDVEIDACWRRLYHEPARPADPDLIRPAQRLEVPP